MPRQCSLSLPTAVLAALVAYPAAAGHPMILVDLPATGRSSTVVPALSAALKQRGISVAVRSAGEPVGIPAAMVAWSGSRYGPQELETLASYVRKGGGLVYLVGLTGRHAAPSAALLSKLGIVVEELAAQRTEPRLLEHPVTAGVGDLPSLSAGARVSGPALQALIRQGDEVVGGVAHVEAGRVVVLPLALVTSASAAPSPGQVRLLANACLWAAGLAAETAPQPAAPTSQPTTAPDGRPRPLQAILSRQRLAPSENFRDTILVDILAADDNWDLIADGLDTLLRDTGLPVRYLDSQVAPSSLVQALDSQPRLLVIGSTRRFTVPEAMAVSHYVHLGGRLLVIAHATPRYTIRLIDINGILGEFGITAALIRPEGTCELATGHAMTVGLQDRQFMPWGIALWSTQAERVARIGRQSFLSALEENSARIVVMDGKLLLVGTRVLRPVKPGEPLPFAPLVRRAIGWLLEESGG